MTRIYCDSSTREACLVLEEAKPKPIFIPYSEPVTNNVGEYMAVILALEEAKRLKLEQVEVLTDSLLVVNQVGGLWKCQKPHLQPLMQKVRELVQLTRGSTGCSLALRAVVRWVSREENLAGKFLG